MSLEGALANTKSVVTVDVSRYTGIITDSVIRFKSAVDNLGEIREQLGFPEGPRIVRHPVVLAVTHRYPNARNRLPHDVPLNEYGDVSGTVE